MLGAKGISMPKRYLALLVGAFVLVPQWESASAQMDFGLDEAEGATGEGEAEPIPEEDVPSEDKNRIISSNSKLMPETTSSTKMLFSMVTNMNNMQK